jgi:hypothetical protein
VARAVHHVHVDQHGIDDPTHFDQLLPLPAIASKARDLARRHRPHFAQTDLRDHPFETRAGDQAGSRPAQVFIHDLDLAPA